METNNAPYSFFIMSEPMLKKLPILKKNKVTHIHSVWIRDNNGEPIDEDSDELSYTCYFVKFIPTIERSSNLNTNDVIDYLNSLFPVNEFEYTTEILTDTDFEDILTTDLNGETLDEAIKSLI